MKYYISATDYNCGIDLHSKNMYVCLMDRAGAILVHENIRDNDFGYFLKLVEPYRHDLTVTNSAPNVQLGILPQPGPIRLPHGSSASATLGAP